METTYKPLPQISSNDVTLLLGSSIGSNIDASLVHSKELVNALPAGSVLYINTVQNTRATWESARMHGLEPSGMGTCMVDGNYRRYIYILNIPRGDLYDPNTMPKKLLDKHRDFDSSVDACYRKTPFKTELERLEYLFSMYKELTKDLFTGKKSNKRKKIISQLCPYPLP